MSGYDTNKLEAGRLPQELLTLHLDRCALRYGEGSCRAGVVASGTAQAGTSTSITLDAADTGADDAYVDMRLAIVGGTGAGQEATVTDYVASTKVATVDAAFSPIPDATSEYEIKYRLSPNACRNTAKTCQDEANYDPSDTLTLRFSREDQAPILGENVWPALVPPVRLMPAKIDPGRKGLGRREEVTFTLRDFVHDDVGIDPYAEHRTHDTTQGTFMGKLLAANPYVHNRPCEYGRGFMSTPPDIANDFKTRHYVIDRIEGPKRGGEYHVVAKDPLALLYSPKAQLPALSPGELAADITAGALSLTLSPPGITDDYPDTGEVNIRGETIEYTGKSVDGSGVVTLSWPDTSYRGKWGTAAIAHSAGDRVQLCKSWVDVRIDQVVRDVITAGNLTDAQLDLAGWDEICDLWFSDVVITNHLTKPKGVDDLLGELQQLIAGHWVWDPISQQVVMRHEMPEALNAAVPVLTDTTHLVGRNVEVSEERDRWISQVWVYYAPVSYSEGDDDENFQYVAIAGAVNEEGAARQDDRNVMKIYARWFDATNASQANGLAQRVLNRFKVPPRRVRFTLEAKDDGIGIGDHIAILTSAIQGETGAPEQTELQVTSLKELAQIGRFELETLSYAFGARYCFFADEAAPDFATATALQKAQNGYYCDDTTERMADDTDPYLYP